MLIIISWLLLCVQQQTLDVIEDFCASMNYKTMCLTGQTPQQQRQQLVTRFNSSYDDTFVFLLSSKAGWM